MRTAPPAGASGLLRNLSAAIGSVVAPSASAVDRDSRFPSESFAAFRELGLMGYFVPPQLGGLGGGVKEYCEMGASIGECCLSSAIIWVMHCQQVMLLVQCPFEGREAVLREIASRQHLVASVTTEDGKGGDLLRTRSPIESDHRGISIKRRAPIVSYGREARFFLVTMKSGEAERDTSLFLVSRDDGLIRETGCWRSLGMRGTQSVPMEFDVVVGPGRRLEGDFLSLAADCMVPLGHLGWSSAWFGAAKGLYNRVVKSLRKSGAAGSRKLDSELLRNRLGGIRVRLDTMEAMIGTVITRLECKGFKERDYRDGLGSAHFDIFINNLKVAVSEQGVAAVNDLMELSGLFGGYLAEDETCLERVFRDIRSATLMFKNDRLLGANGQLAFIERPRLFTTLDS